MPQDISLCSFGLPEFHVVGGAVDFKSLTVFEEPWAAIGRRAAEIMVCQRRRPRETAALTLVPSTIWHGDSVVKRGKKSADFPELMDEAEAGRSV